MSPIVESLVDAAIVGGWGVVVLYFLWRWYWKRRLVSFCLAAMATGWMAQGLVGPLEQHREPVKLVTVALGAVLWYSIWRVERYEFWKKKEGR